MSVLIIGGRYCALREVGRGGMATVYVAADQKQHREVAVKVFRSDLTALVTAERFLREIEITATLNHPHILPLLDSGIDAHLLFYVMPFVRGGSLRALARTAPIPLDAASRILGEVAGALDYAHARGVIHRDIKPENILFNEGLAVVADFGIARVLTEVGSARVTATGLPIGTLGYMSPEQALGTSELDRRTDVYSLGCVLYELLTGATPAAWPDAEDVELGRFSELPASHRERLDALPGRVEQALVRALALRPLHRFGTPGEFAKSLAAAGEPTTRFTDEQVRVLLQRAAELQAAADDIAAGSGLTMGAVEQIAAQVGIPPVHVREAASVLATPVPARGAALAQPVPTARWDRIVVSRSLPGEVPEEALVAMAAEIQRQLDIVGHISVVPGTLTWSPAAQGEEIRKVVVQVSARAGRTEVLITEDLEISGVRRLALPAGALIGFGVAAAWSHLLGFNDPGALFVLLPLAAAGIIAALRTVIWIDTTERAPKLARLADALIELAHASVKTSV